MEALFIAILLLVTVLDASTSTSMTRAVLEEIFGSSNGTIRDDDYSVVNEADEWTFTVESQTEIALSDFFKSAAPSLADFLKGLAMPSLLALPLEFFRYNMSCRELEVRSSADGESEIVDEFLTMFDVSVIVKVKVSDDDPTSRFYLIHSAASGTWKVGDVLLTLDITEAERKHFISGKISELYVTEFFRTIGIDPLPSGESGKALSERGFSTLSLKSVEIKGLYEPISRNFSLCFSGTPSIENWDTLVLHVVYHRYDKGSQTTVTMAVEVEQFGLSDVVAKISDLDISGIPNLGLQSNVGVLISTDEVNTNLLPDSIGGILREALPFREGVVVIAQLMLSKSYSAKFIMQITSDGFTMRSRAPLSVGEAASAFGFVTESIVLPPGIKDIVSLTVESLTYNKVTKKITASFPLKMNIDLIHDWVKIDEAYANVTFTTTSPVKKEFIYYGKWTMGSATFDVEVKPLPGGYGLSGSGKAMTMQDLLSENQCNFLPGGISLGVLDSLRIVNPSLSVVTEERSIDLWGDAYVGDWVDVSIDVVCESGTSGLRAALGLYVSNKKFSTVLGAIVGRSLVFLDLLGGVDVAVAVSSADFEGRTFKGAKLKQLSYIKKGVTVAALVKIPENTDDPLLKLIRSGLGDDFNFQIRARMTGARDMYVYAGLANMQLGSAITLQTLGLEYELKGKETAIYLWAELLLKNPELLFVAVIKKSSKNEVEVLAQMVGVWERAFGIDWLSFGNIHFFIKFIPGSAPTGFELGGEIHIGEPGSEEQIKGAAYCGLDTTDPENNYFYARVNKLTLQGIVDVLGIDLELPEFLGKTGFPEGLLVSHAPKEKAVAGMTIPKGTRIKGTLDIFGLRVKGDIQLSPTLVMIDLEMSPIELAGGLIKVYASEYDRSRGPRLRADAQCRSTARLRPRPSLRSDSRLS
ncbi:uncharacterized protein [Oscarella lobularis]|uniref:uncharacterized protein n=1 Tax=Oscarella lobularis TaxID=121494 RepID=UPI0033137B50